MFIWICDCGARAMRPSPRRSKVSLSAYSHRRKMHGGSASSFDYQIEEVKE